VTDFEDRIRRDLTAVAALATSETVRPLRDPEPGRALAPRHGPRFSRRWLAPIAVMVAVAVIAGVTVAAHTTTRRPALTVGRPEIYVTLSARDLMPTAADNSVAPLGSNYAVVSATIRDAATGAALTSLQIWPAQPERPQGPALSLTSVPAQIAAAADDRTFAINCQNSLFLLHVAASGRSARLTKLSGSASAPVSSTTTVALSPDGTQLALDLWRCPANGPCVADLEIRDLATGSARIWSEPPASSVSDPYWTDNGKAVIFAWVTGSKSGYRVLSDTAPAGNLVAESTPLPYPPLQAGSAPTAFLTPSGSDLLVVTESAANGTLTFRITDVAPKTGQVRRVLWTFRKHYTGPLYAFEVRAGLYCDILSMAPTGLHALINCPQFGRLDGGTFTPLPGGPTMTAAW
jgi:hypothetical protein